jgi:hypothetical protein
MPRYCAALILAPKDATFSSCGRAFVLVLAGGYSCFRAGFFFLILAGGFKFFLCLVRG